VALAVNVDFTTHTAHLSSTEAGFVIAVPVAIYAVSVWLLQTPEWRDWSSVAFPGCAGLTLLTPFSGIGLYLVAALVALLGVLTTIRADGGAAHDGQRASSPELVHLDAGQSALNEGLMGLSSIYWASAGLQLFVLPPRSPKLNGRVERAQRTHKEEFYQLLDPPASLAELKAQLLE
jgi:hypothetical protein